MLHMAAESTCKNTLIYGLTGTDGDRKPSTVLLFLCGVVAMVMRKSRERVPDLYACGLISEACCRQCASCSMSTSVLLSN